VDLVTFGHQKISQIRAVLAGNSCDEGFFHKLVGRIGNQRNRQGAIAFGAAAFR
jgi:hypothetical protein